MPSPKHHLLSPNPLHKLPLCPNQPQGRGRSLSSAFRNLAAPHPHLPYLPLLGAGPCAGTELLKAAPRAWRCSDSPAARDWGLQTFKRSRGLRRFPFPLSQAVVSPRLPLILQRLQVTQRAVLMGCSHRSLAPAPMANPPLDFGGLEAGTVTPLCHLFFPRFSLVIAFSHRFFSPLHFPAAAPQGLGTPSQDTEESVLCCHPPGAAATGVPSFPLPHGNKNTAEHGQG